MGESAPFWRFSAASYPDLEEARPVNNVLKTAKKTHIGETDTSSGVWLLLVVAVKYIMLFNLYKS